MSFQEISRRRRVSQSPHKRSRGRQEDDDTVAEKTTGVSQAGCQTYAAAIAEETKNVIEKRQTRNVVASTDVQNRA